MVKQVASMLQYMNSIYEMEKSGKYCTNFKWQSDLFHPEHFSSNFMKQLITNEAATDVANRSTF